jgi:hypothetical protein
MQQYTDIYLLLNYSTCFGRPSRPSSEVHKTVVAASGTGHTVWGASFLKRDQIRTLQQDVTVCRYLFTAKLFYMFRASIAPIIRST